MTVPVLKVCGLTRREDARAAAELGAAYLGAVFARESRRAISAEAAAELFAGLRADRVGVFVDSPLAEVLLAARVARLDVIQLHGDENPTAVARLRSEGDWTIWKAIRVRSGDDIDDAVERFAPAVDGLLVDAWSEEARGGTGQRFDWEAAASARERVPAGVRLILAGGLRADNVGRAVSLLRPDAVDVSSGVESAVGVKDRAAIQAFVQALRGNL